MAVHLGPMERVLVQQILDAQHASGAYPACESFSAYKGYSWFRDGSFIAYSMSLVGETESASKFHNWVASAVTAWSDRVDGLLGELDGGAGPSITGMLPTRLSLQGEEVSEGWWNHQVDGFGTWLWAIGEFVEKGDEVPTQWIQAMEVLGRYLCGFGSLPCYDWWEEHIDQIHSSTLGCVIVGLRVVERTQGIDTELRDLARVRAEELFSILMNEGVHDGHLTKWLGSDAVDGSLSALIAPLRVINPRDPLSAQTIEAVTNDLSVGGGVYRFQSDTYFGGGRWPILSAFLGLAQIEIGNTEAALKCRDWIRGTFEEGIPEQDSSMLLAPDHLDTWREKWGESAHPLLWSNAMYLALETRLQEIGVSHETVS